MNDTEDPIAFANRLEAEGRLVARGPLAEKQREAPGAVPVEGTYLIPQALRALRLVWQGRVAVVPKSTRDGIALRYTVDDQPATAGVDMDLFLLDRDGYISHPPLLVGEEWAVVRTTDLGEATLTLNGADIDRFVDR